MDQRRSAAPERDVGSFYSAGGFGGPKERRRKGENHSCLLSDEVLSGVRSDGPTVMDTWGSWVGASISSYFRSERKKQLATSMKGYRHQNHQNPNIEKTGPLSLHGWMTGWINRLLRVQRSSFKPFKPLLQVKSKGRTFVNHLRLAIICNMTLTV